MKTMYILVQESRPIISPTDGEIQLTGYLSSATVPGARLPRVSCLGSDTAGCNGDLDLPGVLESSCFRCHLAILTLTVLNKIYTGLYKPMF